MRAAHGPDAATSSPRPQNEETTTTLRFLKVDCAPLKQALGGHCAEWQRKFFTLLNTTASTARPPAARSGRGGPQREGPAGEGGGV